MATSEEGQDPDRALRVTINHPLRVWVDAMESVLKPRWDIEVVAAHTSSAWVRHSVLTEPSDLLLIHLAPGCGEALDMLPELLEHGPGLRVVGLSDSEDGTLLHRAVRIGVRGWLHPAVSVEQMLRVMRGVSVGETWIPPRLMTTLLDTLLSARDKQDHTDQALSRLSARELDVLKCLSEGLSRQEIADRFFLSPHTVRTHINHLLRKLNVHSTLAAVALARQAHLPNETPTA